MLHCSPIRTLLRGSKANAGFQKFKLDADKQKAFQNSRKAPAENPYPFQPSSDPQMSCIDAQRAILDFRVLFWVRTGRNPCKEKSRQTPAEILDVFLEWFGIRCIALRWVAAWSQRAGFFLDVCGPVRKTKTEDGTQDSQLPLKIRARVHIPAAMRHASDDLSGPL